MSRPITYLALRIQMQLMDYKYWSYRNEILRKSQLLSRYSAKTTHRCRTIWYYQRTESLSIINNYIMMDYIVKQTTDNSKHIEIIRQVATIKTPFANVLYPLYRIDSYFLRMDLIRSKNETPIEERENYSRRLRLFRTYGPSRSREASQTFVPLPCNAILLRTYIIYNLDVEGYNIIFYSLSYN